jgi:hypothetical protein
MAYIGIINEEFESGLAEHEIKDNVLGINDLSQINNNESLKVDNDVVNDNVDKINDLINNNNIEEAGDRFFDETKVVNFSEENLSGTDLLLKKLLGSYNDEESKSKIVFENSTEKPEIKSLSLGIYNKKLVNQNFINFTKALKFSIKEIKAAGAFYIVFETDHLNIKMDIFSTEIKILREVIVPIENEEFILVRLFRHSLNGDFLVSEEFIESKKLIDSLKKRMILNLVLSYLIRFVSNLRLQLPILKKASLLKTLLI